MAEHSIAPMVPICSLVVFFFLTLFVVGNFEDCAGFGEVEAFGGGVDGADDVWGVGFGVEACGVHAGELETVEEGGGASGLEVAGGEGVDDDGEGDLDGLAVFEGGQFDVLAGDEVAASGGGGAEAGVGLVEVGVVVAPLTSGEGWRAALDSPGSDVAA